MKKDYTHICIVLDSSGSMECIESDTKGSFNGFIQSQKNEAGKTVFDIFQFSDKVERIVTSVDLATFDQDFMANYHCSGCTALNDAICIAIDTIGQEFSTMPEEERPENVLFVILTDGMENASRQFTLQNVQDRVSHQTKVYNWEFIYLAANIDAFETGKNLGIAKNHCMPFEQSRRGMEHVQYSLMCCAQAMRAQDKKDVDNEE